MKKLKMVALLGFFSVLPFGIGCGGSAPVAAPTSLASAQTGRATLTIRWPSSPTRLIPLATQALRITIQDSTGKTCAEQVVTRPTTGNQSTVTLELLPVGALTATVTALPQSTAEGTALATATAPLRISANTNTTIVLTLQSSIETIELAYSPSPLRRNGIATMTIVAKNRAGEIVMTSPDNWRFTSSRPEIGKLVGNGSLLQAVWIGTTEITATETETGKTITTPVRIIPDTDYHAIQIEKPSDAITMSTSGVNNKGWVVGALTNPDGTDRPFFWKVRADRSGGDFIPVLPYPGSTSTYFREINEDGVVLGFARPAGGGRAVFFHWENGVYTPLPDEFYSASGINRHRQSVGYGFENPINYSLLYTNGSAVRVNVLGWTTATGLNNNGAIIGTIVGGPANQGYRYENGTMYQLATPSGFQGFQPEKITDNNLVLGWCINGPGGILTPGVATTNQVVALPLSPGATSAKGVGITDEGMVVGQMSFPGGVNYPVVWRNGVITKLADLYLGAALTSATGMSSNGTIAGGTTLTAFGYVLIPSLLY